MALCDRADTIIFSHFGPIDIVRHLCPLSAGAPGSVTSVTGNAGRQLQAQLQAQFPSGLDGRGTGGRPEPVPAGWTAPDAVTAVPLRPFAGSWPERYSGGPAETLSNGE